MVTELVFVAFAAAVAAFATDQEGGWVGLELAALAHIADMGGFAGFAVLDLPFRPFEVVLAGCAGLA